MNSIITLQLLDKIGFEVISMLISLFWQTSLLCLSASVLVYFLNQRNAAVRHFVWITTLCMIPIIPLFIWIASLIGAPRAELPVIPVYSVTSDYSGLSTSQSDIEGITVSEREVSGSYGNYRWAIALFIYLTGVLFYFSTVLISRMRMRLWSRNGQVVTDQRIKKLFTSTAGQLGIIRNITITRCKQITAPLTIGSVKPVILVPPEFLHGLSETELRSFAIHELSHVKRFDSSLFTFVALVRSLLFFNPLVWYASRQISILAENACDDIVVETSHEPVIYAEMLTRLAATLPNRYFSTELAAGFIVSKHAFIHRIEKILIKRKSRIRKLSISGLAGIVLVLAASLIVVCSVPLVNKQKVKNGFDYKGQGKLMRAWLKNPERNRVIITGTVVDPNGNPVSGATVAPAKGNGNSLTGDTKFSVMTDTDGRFTMTTPADGKYRYNLMAHDGDLMEWRSWANGITEPLDTKPGGRIDDVTIKLNRPSTVSGTVRDKNGNPVADHTVYAHHTDPCGNRYYDPSAKTDENGNYSLHYIRHGANVIFSANMMPLDADKAPEGIMKRVTLSVGENKNNIDLISMSDKELIEYLNKHATSLTSKIRRRFSQRFVKTVGDRSN
ncbi:M56 family metallopeptidase [Candidatus Omnitrophota bacterium]